MPETSLWGLIVSLALLAFSLTLKISDLRRDLKHAKDDISRLRIDVANEKQQKDQAIANADQSDARVSQQLKRIRAHRPTEADEG